ncbi:MAG TPA: hypothetical protein VEB20_12745 [Azospirillaceae bacterium]|nr:hypothetical protein [Azospirillaceae bacterium]
MPKEDGVGKKAKLPKRIAGFKVPKALRRVGALDRLVNSPTGRRILAEALMAAAAAAAAALTRAPAREALADAGGAVADAGAAVAGRAQEAGSVTRDMVQAAAGAVAGVVADAVGSALPLGHKEKPARRPDRPPAPRGGPTH